MNRLLAIILLAATLLCAAPQVVAQEAPYKFDFGASLGTSGYLGDVNESNLYKHPGFAGAAQFRYIMNTRFALRTQLGFSTISGNSEDFKMIFPDGQAYKFSAKLLSLDERFEVNFFPYGIGETYKRLRRWTPFMAVGLGATLSMSDGNTNVALSIPMTVGVKYKPAERWNLALEFTMSKNFGDKLDGNITDLYQIKSQFGKNTDWTSAITVGATYEFGRRCETCNRID